MNILAPFDATVRLMAVGAERLPLNAPVALGINPALHRFPVNLPIHTMRLFDALLSLSPFETDLPLRPLHAHATLLPLDANLALWAFGPHLARRAFSTHLTLRTFGALSAAVVPLDTLGRWALAALFLWFGRRRRRQRECGTAGNPHHPGHG